MLTAGFLLGFAGSLHCVGMCSPLALQVRGKGNTGLLINRLLYHAGRATTYLALGVVAGLLGKAIEIQGVQNYFSIAAGVVVLAILIFPNVQNYMSPMVSRALQTLKVALKSRLQATGRFAVFTFGALNGLLPCGLVYMALVIAVAQSGFISSSAFMLMFAAGTIPALLAATYSLPFLRRVLPISLAKWRMALLVITAVVLIGRGLPSHFLPIHASMEGVTICR